MWRNLWSPRLAKLRQSDCTVDEFVLESVDQSNCFEQILSLCFGSSVSFDAANCSFIRSVRVELEAVELSEELFGTRGGLNESNVIERLKYSDLVGSFSALEIEFAAFHFFGLDQVSLFELSPPMLSTILNGKSLQLESEDCLYEMVSSLISKNKSDGVLLSCLAYEYISDSSIESFTDVVSESFDFLTIDIWSRLRARLISGPTSSVSGRTRGTFFSFGKGRRLTASSRASLGRTAAIYATAA
jgi:hypothetical protein